MVLFLATVVDWIQFIFQVKITTKFWSESRIVEWHLCWRWSRIQSSETLRACNGSIFFFYFREWNLTTTFKSGWNSCTSKVSYQEFGYDLNLDSLLASWQNNWLSYSSPFLSCRECLKPVLGGILYRMSESVYFLWRTDTLSPNVWLAIREAV